MRANIVAVHHQHFFNFRLDMDVDGVANEVREVNAMQVPMGPQNPHGNAFVMEETRLRTERDAARRVNAATSRTWKIANPSSLNALGEPVGYALIPGETAMPLLSPENSGRKRARFIENSLWVTHFAETEQYAAGQYPNQSGGGEGLPVWISNNESLDDTDVVLWYTVGSTHLPRSEEWPVMPVAHVGFLLRPSGFFARNPTTGIPR